jgi:hypothetical protein
LIALVSGAISIDFLPRQIALYIKSHTAPDGFHDH